MMVIPIAVNKVEIEFEDGITIEIYEVDTGHKIILPKDMRLEQHISEYMYRIVRRDENEEGK